jgi:secondary thiamine-phosphate synthase enzyme
VRGIHDASISDSEYIKIGVGTISFLLHPLCVLRATSFGAEWSRPRRSEGPLSHSQIAAAVILNHRVKSLTEQLWFEVPHRRGFVNITRTVEELVSKSGVREGLCLVNAMHITASVFINDAEEGLLHDYEAWLEKLAPHAPTSQYRHNRTGEDNADAHLKRQIMGREVVVAITNGKLDFGPWEQIFYGEFDGRRRKRALVKIIGE